jgi:hypothetical protein
LRTTIVYIVGVTGLAVALVLAFGVGSAWSYLTKRRRNREEDEERNGGLRSWPTSDLPRGSALSVMTSRMTHPPGSTQLQFAVRCDPQVRTPGHRHSSVPVSPSQIDEATTGPRGNFAAGEQYLDFPSRRAQTPVTGHRLAS